MEGNQLEVVDEMRILGIVFRSDLKWSSNTQYIVERGFSRIWMLKRLKNFGVGNTDLLDVFVKQIRSVLEMAVPAWHPGLTLSDTANIERVQRAACQVILGDKYSSYSEALQSLQLDSLAGRREALCLKFGKKAMKDAKHSNWFKFNDNLRFTRQPKDQLCPVVARTKRFEDSPVSYLTRLLNTYLSKKKK